MCRFEFTGGAGARGGAAGRATCMVMEAEGAMVTDVVAEPEPWPLWGGMLCAAPWVPCVAASKLQLSRKLNAFVEKWVANCHRFVPHG